jgi:uncharacterized protein YndB with AHSA1/START domain
MKTSTIRQVVTVAASPVEVYRVLMSSRLHAEFTGAPAKISPRVGGTIMAWGGYIHGMNLALVPGKRIVQAWRPSEETWPKDHDSKVQFELSPTPRGTRIRFTHSNVPAEHAAHLSKGWHESYWEPLSRYFREKSS